jgi:SNF2 family DNA or RNA helicase
MPLLKVKRSRINNRSTTGKPGKTKYDADHQAFSQTYGAMADIRRVIADSKEDIERRAALLDMIALSDHAQKTWLYLDDYFKQINLTLKEFSNDEWWMKIQSTIGNERLQELALQFLRSGRPLPPELEQYADYERLAALVKEENETMLARDVEEWMFTPERPHLDAPTSSFYLLFDPVCNDEELNEYTMNVRFQVTRPRLGTRCRSLDRLRDTLSRAAHERELFPVNNWLLLEWVLNELQDEKDSVSQITLNARDLHYWLIEWGASGLLKSASTGNPLYFHNKVVTLEACVKKEKNTLKLYRYLLLPDGTTAELKNVKLFMGAPRFVLINNEFYLLACSSQSQSLGRHFLTPTLPLKCFSSQFIQNLCKKHYKSEIPWEDICMVHHAKPRFIMELHDNTIQVRLRATSENNGSIWIWNGTDWSPDPKLKGKQPANKNSRLEYLDDPRLEKAVNWLRKFDWFTPEHGLWISDATEEFFNNLSRHWNERPEEAEYLGNSGFQNLFLNPKRLRPTLVVSGSGIDWLSVSTEWEIEGMKLTKADLQQLATASNRFVKLPDSGWVELDMDSVHRAQETMSTLGIDELTPIAQKVDMMNAVHLNEETLSTLSGEGVAKLRERVAAFDGIPKQALPDNIHAQLRSYQYDGFNFLCFLAEMGIGGILADDMGLGKTLQTLTWILWLKNTHPGSKKAHTPSLVVCPASVLHNWEREAIRFTPDLSVLVVESCGEARHHLKKEIPHYDLVIINYSLLRRELENLLSFKFNAIVLDEAQYIKNPTAQVTQAVKKLHSSYRIALTGTPLENRLLDLWSITDFVQPGYLGNQHHFSETYTPRDDSPEVQSFARKKLSARLRPILLRRLKTEVAKDLPERIDERRDCELTDEQRKLYLAELRRSRDIIMKTVQEKGLAKSKIHVLAALTRLRQICCHPSLVGNNSISGKTETLFDILESLQAEGQKVLVFSQFVEMLKILQRECAQRGIKTHMLTGATKNRQEVVREFQEDPEPCVFLLSLRAAGTGLNLTAASYVVLYDPWWNPAVEAQAIDRTHRIGQTCTVNAYRLISPGTVEEKIWELQQKKSKTISDVLGEQGFTKNLTGADLEYLFSE